MDSLWKRIKYKLYFGYKSFVCFLIGHNKVERKSETYEMNNLGISISSIPYPACLTFHFSYPDEKYDYKINFQACRRCGIYSEKIIAPNAKFLSDDERAIKDIIE